MRTCVVSILLIWRERERERKRETERERERFYYRLRRSNMTYENKKYYISRDTCESESERERERP